MNPSDINIDAYIRGGLVLKRMTHTPTGKSITYTTVNLLDKPKESEALEKLKQLVDNSP